MRSEYIKNKLPFRFEKGAFVCNFTLHTDKKVRRGCCTIRGYRSYRAESVFPYSTQGRICAALPYHRGAMPQMRCSSRASFCAKMKRISRFRLFPWQAFPRLKLSSVQARKASFRSSSRTLRLPRKRCSRSRGRRKI